MPRAHATAARVARAAGTIVALAVALAHAQCGGSLAVTTGPHAVVGFHGDRARTGWIDDQPALAPDAVASGGFGVVWRSPELDALTADGVTYPAHLYASPLAGVGRARGLVYAATSNAWAYAIRAADGAVAWSRRLGDAHPIAILDGGVPMGVLSTPVLDASSDPPRLYVTSEDARAGWQVHALDALDGAELEGWPVTLDDASVAPANRNGTDAHFQAADTLSQRGALALDPSGDTVYVTFGGYTDGATGWIVAVDTTRPRVRAAFSGTPSNAFDAQGRPFAGGGMWSSGGASIDTDGRVFVTTGNSPEALDDAPHVWGQSLLVFSRDLELAATFTPFNHCQMDAADTDLGGSTPVLLPHSPLVAFGGKQGTLYLLDRARVPGGVVSRPPCSDDSASDASLLPPGPEPQFLGKRGPLNVFGPYSETQGNLDYAKMRSTPAYYEGEDGRPFVVVSGASKASAGSSVSVPPCLARLRVDLDRTGGNSYLAVDALESETTFVNPGSPVVTSYRRGGAIAWVLDENALRVQSLLDPATPAPVLYAFDLASMRRLWRSAPGDLARGGKYSTPAVVDGRVIVGTDRLVAFGVR